MVTVPENDAFYLDGVSCSSVGLYCDTPPIQALANSRGAAFSVGMDEDMYEDDDSFDDISFTFTCYVFLPDDFNTSAVYEFLRNKEKLSMSRNDGYYYRIRTISCSPSAKYDGKRIRYQITVQCAPFRYIANETAVTISGSGTLTNQGTRYSKPLYLANLSDTSGSGGITINGQQFTFEIPTSISISTKKIYIDAENALVYDGNGNNLMMYTVGDIPFLSTGVNSIQASGIISNLEVTPNARCY